MAILKHIASKNADYGKAYEYLIFQHNEITGKAVRDESGNMVMREEYYLDGINCEPSTFDIECEQLNEKWGKNQHYNDIKSHHYIISFDPKDVSENGLTGEKAQQLVLEFAKKNFPGHQILVCTHTDGHNGSGNIHTHIILNSLRKFDVERQNFMERLCDSRAGYKHHQTKNFLNYLQQAVMDMCRQENLHQIDLLAPADKKVTDREYRARQKGQIKMDQRNRQMLSDGISPRKTVYQTQKDDLRAAIDEIAADAQNLEEFQNQLLEKYGIVLKISRGRFSYLHPDRQKAITGRMLGANYEKDYLIRKFKENAGHMVFIKSDLRLVVDLQQCVKAQQNRAYAQKVKLSNLKEMAKTIAYVQEHGYDSYQDLLEVFENSKAQTSATRKALRSTEQELKKVNEQIHHTGQYLANKKIYAQYLKSGNKNKFRQEHHAEITLYETARKFLKEHSGTDKLPSLKMLKEEKEKLTQLKNSQYSAYQNSREQQKELKTVCSNVDMILENRPMPNSEHHIQPSIL